MKYPTIHLRILPCPFCGEDVEVQPYMSHGDWLCEERHACHGHDEVEVAERLAADHSAAWDHEYWADHGPMDPL